MGLYAYFGLVGRVGSGLMVCDRNRDTQVDSCQRLWVKLVIQTMMITRHCTFSTPKLSQDVPPKCALPPRLH